MLKNFRGWLPASIFPLFALAYMSGQDFSPAVTQLVSKIASRNPAGSASLTLTNRSSLSDSVVSSIRAELQRQLEAHGWKLKKPEEIESSITVTLSENVSNYVWTAEIRTEDRAQSVFLELARPKEDALAANGYLLLPRTLLISSDTPLVDVTLLEGKIAEGAHLLALTPSAVQVYEMQSSQWRLNQSQPLNVDPIASRDLRGRIVPDQGSSFDAYLPGLHCTGTTTATLTVVCRESDDPWPLSDDRRTLAFYAAHRDYFNGVVTGMNAGTENGAPFYSAAILGDHLIYAGTDGQIRSSDPGHRLSSIAERWGSDLAAIQSSCNTDAILATSASDFNAADAVAAFRPQGSEFNAASERISFSGPVVSLKTSADRQQALAVIASLSGRYEAYLLTARCAA
jgi:DNA polymerase III psi subunit